MLFLVPFFLQGFLWSASLQLCGGKLRWPQSLGLGAQKSMETETFVWFGQAEAAKGPEVTSVVALVSNSCTFRIGRLLCSTWSDKMVCRHWMRILKNDLDFCHYHCLSPNCMWFSLCVLTWDFVTRVFPLQLVVLVGRCDCFEFCYQRRPLVGGSKVRGLGLPDFVWLICIFWAWWKRVAGVLCHTWGTCANKEEGRGGIWERVSQIIFSWDLPGPSWDHLLLCSKHILCVLWFHIWGMLCCSSTGPRNWVRI